jgi:hypothetical protein
MAFLQLTLQLKFVVVKLLGSPRGLLVDSDDHALQLRVATFMFCVHVPEQLHLLSDASSWLACSPWSAQSLLTPMEGFL